MAKNTPGARRQSRPGRLPDAARDQRRREVLGAALELVVDVGYANASMTQIARHAGASKETLYSWFGDRAGLFEALVQRNAEQANAGLAAALDEGRGARATLEEFGTQLLDLLLGEAALAINRAAIGELGTNPGLAKRLLAGGRFRTGDLMERYLQRQMDAGSLARMHPGDAFQLLYGLVVQDLQIRALLGDPAIAAVDRAGHAADAVGRFLELLEPGRS